MFALNARRIPHRHPVPTCSTRLRPLTSGYMLHISTLAMMLHMAQGMNGVEVFNSIVLAIVVRMMDFEIIRLIDPVAAFTALPRTRPVITEEDPPIRTRSPYKQIC
jgi:hypothetical protein